MDEDDYLILDAITKAIEEKDEKMGDYNHNLLDHLYYSFYIDHKNVFEKRLRTGYEKLNGTFKLVESRK